MGPMRRSRRYVSALLLVVLLGSVTVLFGAGQSAKITAPVDKAKVSGLVEIKAEVTGSGSVAYVLLVVDETRPLSTNTAPCTFELDTRELGNGPHKVLVEAYDSHSLIATSKAITINVQNQAAKPAVAAEQQPSAPATAVSPAPKAQAAAPKAAPKSTASVPAPKAQATVTKAEPKSAAVAAAPKAQPTAPKLAPKSTAVAAAPKAQPTAPKVAPKSTVTAAAPKAQPIAPKAEPKSTAVAAAPKVQPAAPKPAPMTTVIFAAAPKAQPTTPKLAEAPKTTAAVSTLTAPVAVASAEATSTEVSVAPVVAMRGPAPEPTRTVSIGTIHPRGTNAARAEHPAVVAAAPVAQSVFPRRTPVVVLNGNPIHAGVVPMIIDGRVHGGFRSLFTATGATIFWLSDKRTARAVLGSLTVEVPIGSRFAKVNGQLVDMGGVATIQHGRTMMPVRFFARVTGSTLSWNPGMHAAQVWTPAEAMAQRNE